MSMVVEPADRHNKAEKEYEEIAFGAFMIIYRSSYNSFLLYWFDSRMYKKEFHRNLGTTINLIHGGNLKKHIIPFPSEEEQKNSSITFSCRCENCTK
jgi:restriction endonuclease S subunit